jgi:hypothetical protein
MRAAVHVDRSRQTRVLAHDEHLIAALDKMERRGVRLDASRQIAVAIGHHVALTRRARLRWVAGKIETRLRRTFRLFRGGRLRRRRQDRARKLRGQAVEAAGAVNVDPHPSPFEIGNRR